MVIASLELFEDDSGIENQPITAFEVLEISKKIRARLRQIAENMQILEDMDEHFVRNDFSVDAELSVPNIAEAKKYIKKLGLEPDDFDFVETD